MNKSYKQKIIETYTIDFTKHNMQTDGTMRRSDVIYSDDNKYFNLIPPVTNGDDDFKTVDIHDFQYKIKDNNNLAKLLSKLELATVCVSNDATRNNNNCVIINNKVMRRLTFDKWDTLFGNINNLAPNHTSTINSRLSMVRVTLSEIIQRVRSSTFYVSPNSVRLMSDTYLREEFDIIDYSNKQKFEETLIEAVNKANTDVITMMKDMNNILTKIYTENAADFRNHANYMAYLKYATGVAGNNLREFYFVNDAHNRIFELIINSDNTYSIKTNPLLLICHHYEGVGGNTASRWNVAMQFFPLLTLTTDIRGGGPGTFSLKNDFTDFNTIDPLEVTNLRAALSRATSDPYLLPTIAGDWRDTFLERRPFVNISARIDRAGGIYNNAQLLTSTAKLDGTYLDGAYDFSYVNASVVYLFAGAQGARNNYTYDQFLNVATLINSFTSAPYVSLSTYYDLYLKCNNIEGLSKVIAVNNEHISSKHKRFYNPSKYWNYYFTDSANSFTPIDISKIKETNTIKITLVWQR